MADVILAKGHKHAGAGIGGVKTHREISSPNETLSHMPGTFRRFVGLKADELKMDEAGELPLRPDSLPRPRPGRCLRNCRT